MCPNESTIGKHRANDASIGPFHETVTGTPVLICYRFEFVEQTTSQLYLSKIVGFLKEAVIEDNAEIMDFLGVRETLSIHVEKVTIKGPFAASEDYNNCFEALKVKLQD